MAEHLLALDLGTTGVRAAVFHADGGLRGQAYRRLTTNYPADDRVEQDAAEFRDGSCEVMRAALAEAAVPATALAGIGLVTQRGAAIAWDRQTGAPLAPVIGWQDRRTLPRIEALQALGIGVNTMASASKFEWLLQHVPAVGDAAQRGTLCLGTPDAWLTWCMSAGAAFVTDPSNASATALYLPGHDDWFPDMLALFDQQPQWHPQVLASNAAVGVLHADWLGAPVPLLARAGDQQAACFAQDVRRPGAAKLTLGTSAMLDVPIGDEPTAAPPGCYTLPLWRLQNEPEAFLWEGNVMTAGAALDWLARAGLLDDVTRLDVLADAGRPGVTFVPALAGLGAPRVLPAARGAFFGLALDSTREDLVLAAVEGVAQRCADLCEWLAVRGTLRVDGGLARSARLLQLLADLSGCEVQVAAETETTARGAAAMAASCAEAGLAPLPPAAAASTVLPRITEAERSIARARWQRALDAVAGYAEAD